MLAVGLMSGTSLDGIDAALCEISGHGQKTKLKLLEFVTYPLEDTLVKKIKMACFKESSSVDLICSLNFELGYAFSKAVSCVLEKAGKTSEDLDFIASHGQTIYHQPFSDDTHIASTLQIGEPAIIAYQHNCPVVSNFRVMDMAAGGQGAPLVPYSEYLLYGQKDVNMVLLNIGGIGNVTWLDGSLDLRHILAFDTGPGNMMVNAAMKKLYQQDYDNHGQIGATGKLIDDLYEELISDRYFALEIPKSTGREWFGEDRTLALVEKYQDYPHEDIIYTLTAFTVYGVVYHIEKYLAKTKAVDLLLVGGGGAHNLLMMDLLRKALPKTKVMTQDEYGYHSDAKEALAFVVMGNETLHQAPSNVPSATGAKELVILGNITPCSRKRGG